MSKGGYMFTNKAKDGRNNICGIKIAELRKAMGISQRELADKMQLAGIDMDKNAVQRIEQGKRFVTDIELKVFAVVLSVDINELVK